MSIRLLKTLIAISEKGSFGAAADVVCVSHAAVSQQMKRLEDELQVSLFDRGKRSPELNQLGQAMVRKAHEVVRSYETMIVSLLGEDGLMGELTIGAVPTTLNGLVPCSINKLRKGFPKLRIRVVPGLSADLLPQVERGALDAAIISGPETALNHLKWQPFAAEPLVVLAAPDAPSDDPIYLLENYPYIRFTRRAWVGLMIDRWLVKMNVKVQDCMELETLESISSMVMYNQGVSIVPQSCLPPPEPLKVKRIPLGPSINPRILGVISRGDSVKFRLIDALVAELTDAVESAGQVRVIRPREGRSQEQSSFI